MPSFKAFFLHIYICTCKLIWWIFGSEFFRFFHSVNQLNIFNFLVHYVDGRKILILFLFSGPYTKHNWTYMWKEKKIYWLSSIIPRKLSYCIHGETRFLRQALILTTPVTMTSMFFWVSSVWKLSQTFVWRIINSLLANTFIMCKARAKCFWSQAFFKLHNDISKAQGILELQKWLKNAQCW